MTDYHALEKGLTEFLGKYNDVELLESIFNVTAKMIREHQHLTNKPIEYNIADRIPKRIFDLEDARDASDKLRETTDENR